MIEQPANVDVGAIDFEYAADEVWLGLYTPSTLASRVALDGAYGNRA